MTLVGVNDKEDKIYESALVAHRALMNTVTRCIECFPLLEGFTSKDQVGAHTSELPITQGRPHPLLSSFLTVLLLVFPLDA